MGSLLPAPISQSIDVFPELSLLRVSDCCRSPARLFGLLWVQILLEHNAELLSEGLKLIQVLLVLTVVLDLGLDTLKDAHGGGEVVDSAGGLKGSNDDGRGRNKIVGESIV